MNTPRHASAVAKLLAKYLPSGSHENGDRERGIATIQRALVVRKRRLVLTRGLAGLAAAAAAALAFQAPHWLRLERVRSASISIDASPAGRGAALSSGSQAQPMLQRAELEPGQRIDTPAEGGASLRLSTGTAMDLSGRTSFRVESQGALEHFSLQHGELAAHVAKLAVGQRFIISTPDAEVEVRGTRFRLRVIDSGEACGGGSRTRLEVSEGLVEVRSAGTVSKVAAGTYWPADCSTDGQTDAAPRAAATRTPSPVEQVAASHAGSQALTRSGTVTSQHPPSTIASASVPSDVASLLGEQNDLFAQGVALRRQGDSNGALRAFSEFGARFPSSPLAENALVERMRLLASRRSPAAHDEAVRYLARYPNGFAAQEARQISARP
jgi:hypothetical protein